MDWKCEFAKIFETKYQELIHPTMESSIFSNLDRNETILISRNSLCVLDSFVRMASLTWRGMVFYVFAGWLMTITLGSVIFSFVKKTVFCFVLLMVSMGYSVVKRTLGVSVILSIARIGFELYWVSWWKFLDQSRYTGNCTNNHNSCLPIWYLLGVCF